jgi:hypothetical protein
MLGTNRGPLYEFVRVGMGLCGDAFQRYFCTFHGVPTLGSGSIAQASVAHFHCNPRLLLFRFTLRSLYFLFSMFLPVFCPQRDTLAYCACLALQLHILLVDQTLIQLFEERRWRAERLARR